MGRRPILLSGSAWKQLTSNPVQTMGLLPGMWEWEGAGRAGSQSDAEFYPSVSPPKAAVCNEWGATQQLLKSMFLYRSHCATGIYIKKSLIWS